MKIPYRHIPFVSFEPKFCLFITDKECINLFFKNDRIITQRISKTSKNERCNHLLQHYLKFRYDDSQSTNETLYRIFLNIEERPVCGNCNKPATYLGTGRFQRFCSVKCAMNSEEVKQHCKECLQEKYGVDNVYQLESTKQKIRETNLERYGVEMSLQNASIKEKAKRTCRRKYGSENVSQTEHWKQKVKETNNARYGGNAPACSVEVQSKMQKTCAERYGVSSFTKTNKFKRLWKNKEFVRNVKEKEYRTKKKNNSFKKSTPETNILNLLLENYPGTKYQYSSDPRYPFNCDFYIPSLDLFIEYNGHWTHNEHFFDINDADDLKRLNEMKERAKNSNFYNVAIDIWTKRDPLKLKTAKENNLNYLVLWTNDYKSNSVIEKIKELEKSI